MFGIVNVNKPAGMSSRDVVNRIQRLVRPAKVGHAGTLDPLATGVLVVCVGPATRLIPYVQQMPKSYQATFLLGQESDTEDITGHVTTHPAAPVPTAEEISRVLPEFLGRILQRPPAYSALKVGGRRAYALARQGLTVTLQPRGVEIFQLQLMGYAYPRLSLQVRCGSGTYVRSLGRDLAQRLGTTAVMSQLERSAVGGFDIRAAARLEEIQETGVTHQLLSPLMALTGLPHITLPPAQVQQLAQGGAIELPAGPEAAELAAVDEAGRLVAILGSRGSRLWGPKRNFPRGSDALDFGLTSQ